MAYCCCTDAMEYVVGTRQYAIDATRRRPAPRLEPDGRERGRGRRRRGSRSGGSRGTRRRKNKDTEHEPHKNRTQPASPLFAAWWIGARPSPSHWSTSAPALTKASKHAAWARDDPSSALDFFEHGTSFRSPLSSLPPSLTRSRSSIFRWTMHILTQVTTRGSLSSADARISPNLSESLRRASRRWRHASMVSTRSQDHSGVSSVNLGATERARL